MASVNRVQEICSLLKQLRKNEITKEKLERCYLILSQIVDKRWISKALGSRDRANALKTIVENLQIIIEILDKLDSLCSETS